MQVMQDFECAAELNPSAWNQLTIRDNYYLESVRTVRDRDIFIMQIFLGIKWLTDPNLSIAYWILSI